MKCSTVGVCALLLPVFSTLSRAGDEKPQRDDAAIEKVVADGMEAARKADWKKYSELLHPESLDDYKNIWLPALTVAQKGAGQQAELLPLFDKAADLKSVIALKPQEFFISSLKGMASQLSQGITSPLNVEAKVIGTVREGDDRAYVVVRTRRTFDDAEMTQVEMIALRRSGTEWRMMLPDAVRIMAETFRRTGHDTQQSGPVTDRPDPIKKR